MFGKGILENKNLQGCSTCDSSGRNCVNETESGQGVEGADFVLYITAITTDQVRITKETIFLIHKQCLESVGGEAETVAYAAHCQQESGLDRPVAGGSQAHVVIEAKLRSHQHLPQINFNCWSYCSLAHLYIEGAY